MLVARTIIADDGARYTCDPVWSKRLSGALGGAAIADIAGMDAPLAGHEEKHALHLQTGAHAADMESHIAARVATPIIFPSRHSASWPTRCTDGCLMRPWWR
jgi:adenosylhomocysteine nucleosidase